MNFRSYKYIDFKKIIGLFIVISISSCFLIAQENNVKDLQEPLTIEECIQFALQNNPQIQNATLTKPMWRQP